VVSRLRESGAVLVAKLATGELALTTCVWRADEESRGTCRWVARIVGETGVGYCCGTRGFLDRDGDGGSIVEPSEFAASRLKAYAGRVSRWGFMS